MSTCPVVSVIIPVYNTGSYLRDCLDSIVGQTLTDIEILCVDDGSTDDSPAILREYAAGDPRVKIISRENGGLSLARNTGIRAASGKYIYFMDSDDLLDADALTCCCSAMDRDALEFLCFNAEAFGNDEESSRIAEAKNSAYYRRVLHENHVYSGPELFLELRPENHFVVPVWAGMILRSFLLEQQLWFHPGILHEDEAWTFAVFVRASRIGCLNRTFFHRRIRRSSLSITQARFEHAYGCFAAAQDIRDEILQITAPLDPELENLYISHLITLQKSAAAKYRACSSAEKEKRTLLPPDERLSFEQLVVLPAAQAGRQEQLQKELTKEQARSAGLQARIQKLKASLSYRIGRALTWLPRKIKEVFS